MTQLCFPLLTPVRTQAARHQHADHADQPEPETKPICSSRIPHLNITRIVRPPEDQPLLLCERAGNRPLMSPESALPPPLQRSACRSHPPRTTNRPSTVSARMLQGAQ